MSKLAKSSLSKNVTIKGGAIIQHISNDKRRATRDFDLDFIRYSLRDDSIAKFIDALNDGDDGVTISIVAPIEELNHQDYNGKRVYIELVDVQKNIIETKLDIGVHKRLDIEQVEYCFELDSINENVTLLINSKEQMFAEKLKSLLKLGRFSTRYKDLFDMHFLIYTAGLNKDFLVKSFAEFIFGDEEMRENDIEGIYGRLMSIFKSKSYLDRADTARDNWIEIPVREVTESIMKFIREELLNA